MRPHCSICLQNHRLERFRFLPCGHGFCLTSLEQYAPKRAKKPCPVCREPFHIEDAHSVYIQVPSTDGCPTQGSPDDGSASQMRYSVPVLKQAGFASERIKKMDSSSSADTVQRAASEIRKVVEGLDLDHQPCDVEVLLSVLADFLKRTSPVFAIVVAQREEIGLLRNNLRAAEAEKLRLREEVEKAGRIAEDAVETADKARHELVNSREENDRLKKRLEAQTVYHSEQLAAKAVEATGLRNTILAHKDKEAKQKTKISDLRQQLEEKNATISKLCQSTNKITGFSTPKHWQGARQPISASSTQDLEVIQTYPTENANENTTTFGSESELDYLDPDPLQPLPALFPTPRHSPSAPRRPTFGTDWNLKPPQKRKRTIPTEKRSAFTANVFPIALDERGRTKGQVQLGSRQKLKFG